MTPITLNIGLDRADGGRNSLRSVVRVLAARLPWVGRYAVHTSDTEATVVVEVGGPGVVGSLSRLARELGQDAIAAWDPVEKVGYMEGPNAAAWGDFNPNYFLNLDGSRLGQ